MSLLKNLWSTVLSFVTNFSFAPSYIKVGAIIVLLFLLVVSLASFRKHFVKWSLKGGLIGLFFGFLLALLLEGFLLIGGKTVITEFLGWKNAPKPIKTALDLGRSKLVNVLGITDEIPKSNAFSTPTAKDAIEILQSLNPTEIKKIKAIICTQ
jgi:hypothetical protein